MNLHEIDFFRYMIKNIDYDTMKYNTAFTKLPVEELMNRFSAKYKIERHVLISYLKEWSHKKFFEYDSDYTKKGYFYDLDNLIIFNYKGEYSNIVPYNVVYRYSLMYINILNSNKT